ncbi:MAG: transcriptional regulator NrdR [Spirochaetaceae bacterium]|jgi:transcriptional repressor NrdR|nr:transcriptional regulator NrdR [Spirochaetaceae bacterium]
MRCPHCGNIDDKVIESRTLARGSSTRRRRECNSCGARFTSYERIEEKPFMVLKRDGRREPFDRAKIEVGLERAIQKRPVSQMDVELLVNEVEDHVVGTVERECQTKVIGEMVLEKLGKLDKVAYIRFASVCRRYENLDEFIKEIHKLGGKNDRKSRKKIARD